MRLVQVVLMKKLGDFDNELTYSLPSEFSNCNIGSLVEVSLNRKTYNGVVVAINQELDSKLAIEKIKPIERVSESFQFSEDSLALCRFISDYYRTSLARALKLFFPGLIWSGKVDEPVDVYYELVRNDPGKLGSKQQIIVDRLSSSYEPLTYDDLKKTDGYSSATLGALVKKGLIGRNTKPKFPSAVFKSQVSFDKTLTQKQSEALDELSKTKKPVLLHGVTGSGKTEVYLRLIADAIESGGQALLLLPEIALTPQTIQYFETYFSGFIAIFHSKLTVSKRCEEWWKVQKGNAKLIIGSRSAIFAPFQELKLIILDEEHEWTYKQESSPYYETHRVAEELSRISGATLVFGSATPRAESYLKAKEDVYRLVSLPDRINKKEMPSIQIVDLREEFKKRNFSIFSDVLHLKIKERLARKEQIILFVNQRGHSSAVLCRDCGHTEKCLNCDISLKLHRSFRKPKIEFFNFNNSEVRSSNLEFLKCHYCDFTKKPEIVCPECRSPYIKHVGVGTQRVEAQMRELFPEAKTVRADRDTVSKANDFHRIYHDFQDRKYDVLIGTQMIAKGLDFPNVSLIGLILADVGLHIPDFRSGERLFQIVTQVAGRCGRSDIEGEVILQTYNPDHPTFKMASGYAYREFMDNELELREKLLYPPFNRMIKFTVVGSDQKKLSDHIAAEQDTLEDIFKVNQLPVRILSAPAMISKMGGRFYYHVLIRAKDPSVIFKHWKLPRGWRVDIDPVHTT